MLNRCRVLDLPNRLSAGRNYQETARTTGYWRTLALEPTAKA